jgi:hypothetical protein
LNLMLILACQSRSWRFHAQGKYLWGHECFE